MSSSFTAARRLRSDGARVAERLSDHFEVTRSSATARRRMVFKLPMASKQPESTVAPVEFTDGACRAIRAGRWGRASDGRPREELWAESRSHHTGWRRWRPYAARVLKRPATSPSTPQHTGARHHKWILGCSVRMRTAEQAVKNSELGRASRRAAPHRIEWRWVKACRHAGTTSRSSPSPRARGSPS